MSIIGSLWAIHKLSSVSKFPTIGGKDLGCEQI